MVANGCYFRRVRATLVWGSDTKYSYIQTTARVQSLASSRIGVVGILLEAGEHWGDLVFMNW